MSPPITPPVYGPKYEVVKIQYLFTTHSFTEGDKPTNSILCLLQWNVFAVWKWNQLWKKCRKITLMKNVCTHNILDFFAVTSTILQLSPAAWNRRFISFSE